MPQLKKTAAEKRAINVVRQAQYHECLKSQVMMTVEKDLINQKKNVVIASDEVNIVKSTEIQIQELTAQLKHTALNINSKDQLSHWTF